MNPSIDRSDVRHLPIGYNRTFSLIGTVCSKNPVNKKNQTLLDNLESCLKFNGVLTLIPLISIN